MSKLTLMAKIGLDGKGFKAGIDKVKRQAGNLKADLGKKFSKISALQVAGAVTGYARRQVEEIFEYTKEVKRLASTFSLSTDQIQKFKAAAEAGGINLTQLMDGIKDLGKNTSEALMGVESKIWAFETLGISVDEIRGKKIDEVFMRVAQAVKDIGPILTADQIKAIEDLGGSNLFLSLPVLRSDLEKIFKQLEQLGGVIEEETLDKITMASKRWSAFKTAQRGFWGSVTNLAMGAFMTIANIISSFPDVITSRIDNFKDSLKEALKEGTSLAGFGEFMAGTVGGDLGKFAAQQGREIGGLKGFAVGAAGALGGTIGIPIEPIIRGLSKTAKQKLAAEVAKEAEEVEKEMAEVAEIGKRRLKIQKDMADLQKQQQTARFNELSDANKLLEIEKELTEQRKERAQLRTYTQEEIDAVSRDTQLSNVQKAEKQERMEMANLAAAQKDAEIEATESKQRDVEDKLDPDAQRLRDAEKVLELENAIAKKRIEYQTALGNADVEGAVKLKEELESMIKSRSAVDDQRIGGATKLLLLEKQIAEARQNIAQMGPMHSEERIQGLLTGSSAEAQGMSLLERFAKAGELTKENEALSAEQLQLEQLQNDRAEYGQQIQDEHMKNLSNLEQLGVLEKKLAAERAKLAAMPFYGPEAMASIINATNLTEEQKKKRIDEMTAANAAHQEQSMEVENLAATEEATREEAKDDAQEELNLQNNLAGQAKFDSLARIGGSVGGRNPVLDMAKKQVGLLELLAESNETNAKCLSTLSGVK